MIQGSPILENGERVWKNYSDIFPEIGQAFEQTGQVQSAQVGSATARLFRQRPAVDFAVQWFTRTRQ